MRPAPNLVFWETTAACNLSCRHCRRLDALQDPDHRELDTAAGLDVIDQLAAMTPRPPVLVCSGGEPLQRGDLYQLLDHARDRGVPVAVASNGTQIDRSVAERLRDHGVRRVAISIDGADAETHDYARGLPGSFDAAIAGVQALVTAGLPVQLNATVTTGNAHQLDDIKVLACELGAVELHVFVLVPVGCGVDIPDAERLTPRATELVLNWCAEHNERGPIPIRPTCAPHYQRILKQRARRRGEVMPQPQRHEGCLAGERVLFISHRGEVFPCGYLPIAAGDLATAPLAEIWEHGQVYAELRDRDSYSGACGRCGHRRSCGGCRARAYGVHGDHLGPEPSCLLAAR